MHWELACPSCRELLVTVDADQQRCPHCTTVYRRDMGIWGLMARGRREALAEFVERYETVRAGEGRGTQNVEHLRALPFRDLSRKRPFEWYVRSQSYRALLRRAVRPLERARDGPLRIADLGSGNGWLAYRLALRGHQVIAVDVVTNEFDGLGAHRYYDRAFLPLQAEFDRLPLGNRCVDLAIYNAAIHYARDYGATLGEALRVLAPGGWAVIMDSPLYRDAASGVAMVREREESFERQYGLRRRAIHSEGFLTYDRLAALENQLALRWELFGVWCGLRWWLKPWGASLRGAREPARFKLVIGRRTGES